MPVADIARARGTNRAIETQKGAVFMVAGVGKEINVNWGGHYVVRTVLPIYVL